MPLQSSENRLVQPSSPTAVSADGPVLDYVSPGIDGYERVLRIRARRLYPISRDDLFAIWTRHQGWDAWMRLRARSRSSIAAYPGGAFRLELAEGPTIHVVTGVVTGIEPTELLSLNWVHHNTHDHGSTLDVTFRQHGDHTELTLTHREIANRREASWLMRLWTSALGRLGVVVSEGRPRTAPRVRTIAPRIRRAGDPEMGPSRVRTFAQSAAFLFALATLPRADVSAQSPADSARAASYFASGNWHAAAQAYGTLTRTDTSAVSWYRYGVALDETGRHDDAIVALRRALRVGPPFANQVRYRLARAHVRRGSPDSAIAELDRAADDGYRSWEAVRDDDVFAPIRGDARFSRTLARIEGNRFPCRRQAERRQLDFWVGDWRVVNGSTLLGTNRVELVNGDCAVQENWTSAGAGGGGKSWSFYDASIQKWRQVFIFDSGGIWEYTGELRDGAMHFERSVAATPNTPAGVQRMTFFPIAKDSVRQYIQSSADGGKTWTVDFDGMYVRTTAPTR
jgi:uncharacterized protein YndB with AHSA1/START domain